MYQSNNTDDNTSHYCSDYAMGNCSLCNHNNNNNTNYGYEYLQSENDTNSNASFQNLYNMSNSLSYPLLSREFHSTLTTSNNSQNIISTDTMQSELPSNYVNNNHLLMNTIRDFGWPYFEKSTSAFSLCSHGKSNFSTSYRDCRLRYIKQTRKLQKYLRVTPEGHILVNNPKIEHHHQHILHHNLQQSPSTYSYNHSKVNNTLECKDNFNKYSTTNHDLCNNPFGSLISTPKIKRIYTAFWNLEPRESITVHKLPSSKTISSFNQSTTTTTSSSSSSLNHHQYTNGYNYYLNSNKDDDEHDDDDDDDDEHDDNHPLESTMHNTTTSQKTLETLMEDSINDKLSDY